MFRIVALMWIALAIGSPIAANGQAEVNCGGSERFGGKVIKAGDSERRVIEADPDREVRLENRFGGAAGFRFDFYKRGRTVQIYTRGGVVVRVCRVRS